MPKDGLIFFNRFTLYGEGVIINSFAYRDKKLKLSEMIKFIVLLHLKCKNNNQEDRGSENILDCPYNFAE